MGSAPNHGTVSVTETGLSNKVSAVSLAGHVQQVFSHVRLENLVAGLSGGVVSTLVLHPLDLVKIRFAGMICSYHILSDVIMSSWTPLFPASQEPTRRAMNEYFISLYEIN